MNSLNYLSRQLDVLATAGTPPSTPIKGTHLFNTERPPRAKSYSKILPRRPSHQNQQPHESDEGNSAHASKRSFSSPALWSFRKPSLTPSSSIPPTPAPALKRTTSYDFGQTTTPEITPPLNRSFRFHILSLLWDTIYRLWLTLSGYLVFPTWITGTGPLLKNLKSGSEGDTTADEGEDEEDDGIVTRAPKRSSVDQQHKDAIALSESLETFQMSTTTTLVQEELVSHVAPPILSPDPPTEAEVQARTETPRIDLVPPTPRSKTPPSSLRRSQTPSASLLPNPLSSSLLIKSASSPPGPISIPQQTPPRKMPGHHMQKTLVLDLDETLIHSTSKPLRAHAGGGLLSMGGFGFGFGEKRGREAGHMVEVVLGGRCTLYHVYKRPFVDYFLRKVSSWYTLVIFTASMQEYADPVIDWLDAGRGILTRRLFRESCTQLPNGSYTKDLSIIDDLSRVCLIDNSPVSYNVNPANGIPIEGWMSDPSDEALLHLLPVLDSLRFATDVRRILGLRLFS